ncbi:MAG TPA: pirin family protein [Gammaproteobacteria bacterium]|nr:pirin family protein [Gammaproteobacteria bacterium]
MNRHIEKTVTGVQAADGDGVQLTRLIASPKLDMLDPFLLMDFFSSEKPQDYLGGFPPHPHRGFETVTYMLAGKMRHKDSAGNEGVIEAGGVQWMRAGKGIVHSEMPEQEKGLLAGFQLWVNLPASHKMAKPGYQEINGQDIPEEIRDKNCRLKVIAGCTAKGTRGVIHHEFVDPVYWDIHLNRGATFIDKLPHKHNAFIYLIDGALNIGDSIKMIISKQLAILGKGDKIRVHANTHSRFLLIAGKPLNEPVARGGPFVMNSHQEVQQAFSDYASGKLADKF